MEDIPNTTAHLRERFWELQDAYKGNVILAHPERFQYMAMKDYTRLKSMRVKLQLNLFSLFGKYEKEAQKKQKGCSQKVFMIVWEQIYIKWKLWLKY